MSSDFNTLSISRNLVRVSGSGYRENTTRQTPPASARAWNSYQTGSRSAKFYASQLLNSAEEKLSALRTDMRAILPALHLR